MNRIKIYITYGFRLLWWAINFWRFKKLGIGSRFFNISKFTPKYISCGRNVFIWKYGRIEGISQYNNQFFNPHIVINDSVTVQQNVHITCANTIVIGKNTAIAANVTITDIHHPYVDISIPIEFQDIEVNSVFIGEDCKIYNNVVILPGTKIGKHCTIGANSVVSGQYSDFCVVVGAPAKVIKRYNYGTKQWERTNPDGSFINI